MANMFQKADAFQRKHINIYQDREKTGNWEGVGRWTGRVLPTFWRIFLQIKEKPPENAPSFIITLTLWFQADRVQTNSDCSIATPKPRHSFRSGEYEKKENKMNRKVDQFIQRRRPNLKRSGMTNTSSTT